jgi:hypothetical protein
MSSYDPDLTPVIEQSDNEDLDPLVQIILKAATYFLEIDKNYKKYKPDH